MPVTNFGTIAITPQAFIGRIEDRLRDVLSANLTDPTKDGLPPDAIFLSMATDDEHIKSPPRSRFVTIFPGRFPVWQGVYSGAGETGFDCSLRVTTFCRRTNDQEFRYSNILRDNEGILGTTFMVLQALQGWEMPDIADANKSALREPMRLVGSGPELTTKKESANVWILSWVSFEAKFSAILNTNVPTFT